ncbi:E3 ubiquitin-protein ligase rififylin [Senna tora]|uniref:E3 ubiquitin-protein ligase rififylin n=1 Tax=Senna tora TaxID=362788 RepID=A0A834XHJ0_9FABA|nr:E3 ubiquitin-protein ligase rififylin [Senna tora]
MAEPHSSSAPSSSTANQDASGAASSSSASSSRVRREEESRRDQPNLGPPSSSVVFRGIVRGVVDNASPVVRDDAWSCLVVLFTFWFFVSLTMILGVYGSTNLLIAPYSSILLQPSPLFVQSLQVENLESKPGIVLYGTYGTPALDAFIVWTETHNVTISSDSHEASTIEWKYYLNTGSQVNISYSLSPESSSIYLVIAEGNEGLSQWLEEPTYPNSSLSWNNIHGTGMITQDIFSSSSYYVAVGNLNEEVEVEMTIRVRAAWYNTTDAYYKCTLNSKPCSMSVFFQQNAAVNTSSNEWYVKLSYGPRWVTYIFGMGGMTVAMFFVFNYLNKLHFAPDDRARGSEETAPQRAPLLSYKDDDLSSWGSSYESLPHDEEDLDYTGSTIDGKSLGDGETSNNTRRLCAICFDAPRDCFFLPCGHCVACFECATRIAEAEGTCPVCNRRMKKVRKIFTV